MINEGYNLSITYKLYLWIFDKILLVQIPQDIASGLKVPRFDEINFAVVHIETLFDIGLVEWAKVGIAEVYLLKSTVIY